MINLDNINHSRLITSPQEELQTNNIIIALLKKKITSASYTENQLTRFEFERNKSTNSTRIETFGKTMMNAKVMWMQHPEDELRRFYKH